MTSPAARAIQSMPDSAAPENVDGQLLYWRRTGGGNPELKPWKANTFDLSLEKYFGSQAYVVGGHSTTSG